MKYLGSTQQFLKARTAGHFSDVVKLKNRDIASDTFTADLTKHFKNYDRKITTEDVRKLVDVRIVSELNHIDANKKFGTLDCPLCNEEKIHIAYAKLRKLPEYMNKNLEVCNTSCRHKAQFHFYKRKEENNGADDG